MLYSTKDVVAVVVAYNPDKSIISNVNALLSQVEAVLIYDNGSEDVIVSEVYEQLENNTHIKVLRFKENLGIPARLNQACKYAHEKGYSLLLTMDQDTLLHSSCVEQMIKVLEKDNNIISVGPNRKGIKASEGYVTTDYLITSGNLLVVDMIYKINAFWEKMFIDLVDIETSLFIRSKGYKIAIATSASMQHKVGVYEENKVLFISYKYLSHSIKRFEYMYRNFILVIRLYYKMFPSFCLKLCFFQLIEFMRLLFEKDANQKIKAALRGVLAGKKVSIEDRKEMLRQR